jgi:hypothetical protein
MNKLTWALGVSMANNNRTDYYLHQILHLIHQLIAVQSIHPDQIALSQAVLSAQPISTLHFHLANRNQVVALKIGQNSGKTSTKMVVLTK